MEPAGHVVSESPEPADIIARARAMIPVLAARSLAGRRERRIPDETIADMRRAGLFRVLQPKRWGGYEMELGTFYDVQLALAEGDMSTAWVYGVSGVHPWFMALLHDRAAQEVWGRDDSTLICSSLMPAGRATATEGGFLVGGHWKYVHAACRPDLQGDRGSRPAGGLALWRRPCRSHGGTPAHLQSIRICRQQLGRRDVRSREQGFDGLAVAPFGRCGE
jgi:hypothetical protein